MSEPILVPAALAKHWENESRHAWSENARLKAEVERLDTLCKQVMAQHSDISCENITLRKAGDAMADRLMYQGYPATVPAWLAAKEGKGQP
jgi:hypothetical protein